MVLYIYINIVQHSAKFLFDLWLFLRTCPHTPQAFLETPREAGHILLEGQPQISLISHVEILNMEGTVRRGLQFTVLIQEDLKV